MTRWTVTAPRRWTLDEPVTRLDVRLISGRLSVVGTDGPARIEVSEIGRRPVLVDCTDGHLQLRQPHPTGWAGLRSLFDWIGRRQRVHVSIAVPPATAAALHLVTGTVIASGLRAGARVRVTSGRITLLGLAGGVTAKLVSGPVEALGVAGDLTMETVSGELTLADSTASRIRASAVSGSITCDLDNPDGGEIRLNTTSGEITVRVREDSDLDVHLHTTSGQITCAFPELVGVSARDRRGVLGRGAGTLRASSTSGSVALLARPVFDGDES